MDTNGMSPDTVQQMLALLSQQQPQPTGQDTSLGIGSDPFGMNGGMPNGLSSAPMATNSVPSQGAAPPQFGTNLGGAGDMPLAPAGGTFGADPATQNAGNDQAAQMVAALGNTGLGGATTATPMSTPMAQGYAPMPYLGDVPPPEAPQQPNYGMLGMPPPQPPAPLQAPPVGMMG